ncbi:DoxX family membrane protein [Actinomyces sp. MRS3W]|uniref:DoxX family membrane protein n=1 Tax=Actinomyces sp. MRS3W TaxID=2800796 RepID=UPI0028FD7FAA|nr:DoxX family membrane protein [Actinomyces sp. MRS3W]MDU0349683.1 DoxX family membrane protein [Actinomyces sp. MRS3W]
MDLLRTFARPALAAPFVVDGVDALARPKRHAEKFEKVQPVLEKAGLPPVLHSDAELLTRLTGAVSVLAGLGLATGRAPRSCAAVLAALNIPLALVNHPVWAVKGQDERKQALSELMRSVAVGAGLALSAVDREGRPSLAWQRKNRREQRAALEAAVAQVRSEYEPAPSA